MADDKKNKEQKGNHRGAQTASGTMMAPNRGGMATSGGVDPFYRLREEFNRLFDPFFSGGRGFWEMTRPEGWGMDVDEDEKNLTVHAEAPGFEPDDFDLQVQGNQLVLCACTKGETDEKDRGYHEWRQREFYRSVMLPTGVSAEKAEADYHNGILTVKLPKTEESKSRHIEVKR